MRNRQSSATRSPSQMKSRSAALAEEVASEGEKMALPEAPLRPGLRGRGRAVHLDRARRFSVGRAAGPAGPITNLDTKMGALK